MTAPRKDALPLPAGAVSDWLWDPVAGPVYWGIRSAGDEAVVTVSGVQFSDGRPVEPFLAVGFDDRDGVEQSVDVSFATARCLVELLTPLVPATEVAR